MVYTMKHYEAKRGDYTVSTDPLRLDIEMIYRFLHDEAYWSLGIPRRLVEKSISHSLCFGVYHGDRQVGFARVISDFATMAYLGDVFIIPEYRGRGLSKWLMETILAHPELHGLRQFFLLTGDAHGLYAQFGFKPVTSPERYQRYMEITRPVSVLYGEKEEQN